MEHAGTHGAEGFIKVDLRHGHSAAEQGGVEDIAAGIDDFGVTDITQGTECAAPGSTGFGVRLLTTYLTNLTGKR